MKSIVEQNNFYNVIKPPKTGDVLEGAVIGSGKSILYMDLGAIGTGVVLGREFYAARDMVRHLKKGEKIFAKIVELENEEGYIELSLQAAGKEITWQQLQKQKEDKVPLRVKILGANKGGLLAEVSRIPAFIPSSQLSAEHYPRVADADPTQIVRELQKLIGQELEVYILDLDQREEKLILSEKLKDMEKTREFLAAYKAGDVIDGMVTGVVDFGAFITFPIQDTVNDSYSSNGIRTIEGLCHISELDWQLIEKPENVVQVGQKVKAKIIKIEGDRVFLSLKALKEDPWQNIVGKHKKDDSIRGKVTRLNPFGAFVEVAPGVQGLCHISEFGTKTKMEEILKEGEWYEFIISQMDPTEHKMALKMSSRDTGL